MGGVGTAAVGEKERSSAVKIVNKREEKKQNKKRNRRENGKKDNIS